jgi:geranylgeranyl pyrophosphate synthase
MNTFAEKALSALEKIEANSDKKNALRSFAEQLLIREN